MRITQLKRKRNKSFIRNLTYSRDKHIDNQNKTFYGNAYFLFVHWYRNSILPYTYNAN